MNPFVQDFLRRVEDRFSIDNSSMSMGDWLCANTQLRGRPFSFARYPFQKQIADDMFPLMDVEKPSQVGLSEIQIRKALGFLARNKGTTLIFTLPNETMFERMSTTRVLPIVRSDPAFNLETQNGEKPTRSKGLIQVGTSFMFVTGAGEGDATSISADAVFNDEVDLTPQDMLSLFNSRLQNSDHKISHRFSTPTFADFGINLGYKASDQHRYLQRCDCCGHWQEPLFTPEFVDLPGLPSDMNNLLELDQRMIDDGTVNLIDAQVVCSRCREPLDLSKTEDREWVPKFPGRSQHHRGYRVGPFSTHRLPPTYIFQQLFEYRRRDNMKGFKNTVLGETHEGGNSRLHDSQIDNCFTPLSDVPDPDRSAASWIGIDVGATCHIVLAQGDHPSKLHVVMFKAVPEAELLTTVQRLLKTYNVIRGTVDRHPYTPQANALRDATGGIILPVEYRGSRTLNLVKDPITERVTHAQIDRTPMIDLVAHGIREAEFSFSGYGLYKSTIREHLKDMIRDEQPEQPARWVKLTGNDHYFHALTFMRTAIDLQDVIVHSAAPEDTRSTVAVAGVNMGGFGTNLYAMNNRK